MPTKQRLTAEPPPFIPPQDILTDQMGPIPMVPADTPAEGYEGFSEAENRRVSNELAGNEETTELTEDERSQFETLLTCGKRTKTVDVMGHAVGIESLNVDDDLRIGLYTKDYRESDAYARAIQLATCAAGIRTIDKRSLYQSLSRDETSESVFQAKVQKLLQYHAAVITEIYREIMNLDVEFGELAMKLGKLKG